MVKTIANSIDFDKACAIDTPADVFDKLSKIENRMLQEVIAENPNTPDYVLRKLSFKGIWVKANVAANVNTPIDVLKNLCSSNVMAVYITAARNENTPKNMANHVFLLYFIEDFLDSIEGDS